MKLFPVHKGKMGTQFGNKKYGIPKTTLQHRPNKRFSAMSVERIADLSMYTYSNNTQTRI